MTIIHYINYFNVPRRTQLELSCVIYGEKYLGCNYFWAILVLLQKNLTMQKLLAVIIIATLLSVGTVSAQNFSLSSDSLYGTADANRAEYVLDLDVTNLIPNRPTSVKWKRYENVVANGWLGNQICVYGTCYLYAVDTGTILLQPGVTEEFSAHFGNNNLAGAGVQRVVFYEEDDSATTAKTVYFGTNLTPYTSVVTPMSNSNVPSDIQIYPNPAKEFVVVKRPDLLNISRIEVYNMLGLKVVTQKADPDNTSNRVDLLDLAKGVYMLRIFDNNNNVILTKSISKIR